MSDLLLELSQNPLARRLTARVKLPIPMPEPLARQVGPGVERFLEGERVLVAGGGELGAMVARTIARAGGTACLASEAERAAFDAAAEAYGRPIEIFAGGEAATARGLHAIVFDATGLASEAELRRLYDLFHPFVRKLARSGRVVLLGRPPDQARTLGEAAARAALEGFVRSLAKEIGGKGATANLLVVEPGADERVASPLRFFLSRASAFVSAQPLRISARARSAGDPEVQPLERKVALVTGAARGIGAATARVLAGEGAHVVCLDRPEDDHALAQVAREVNGSVLAVDVSASDAPARIASALRERHGGVDVIVHNAGVTRDRMLANMRDTQWDQLIGINLAALVRITEALLGGVLRDGGRIVSLSSIAGIAGNVGQTNYAASKAGVIGLTRHLAAELAPRGITANAVAPGFIETRMTAAVPVVVRQAGRRLSALGQGGQPEDVARAIAFFATPGASGTTGQVLRVCGGALIGA